MLYPFWGKNPEDPRDPTSGRFDRYTGDREPFFQMTTLEEADVAVFPGAWEHVIGNAEALARAERFIEKARRAGKATVIFLWSDSDEDIPYENTLIFRTSLYRSRRKLNEFAMPAWSEDLVAKYLSGQLPIRSKRERAVVGFCGYVPPSKAMPLSLRQRVKHVLRTGKRFLKNLLGYRRCEASKRANAFIRTAALQALSKSPWIDTNFVIREHFFGHALLPSGETDFAKLQKTRHEYVQNMVESDYILCVRGAGNFSYRLHETLSCGRIPVFVDTDCVLPYHSEIDWKACCIWVDEKELGHIGERVAEFHQSLSVQEFVDLQRECRRLWENYLSPEGFFLHFHKHFKQGD